MTYEQSFHVDAPVTKVFDFFRDPGSWAELEPEGVRFKDVRLTEEGLGTHYSSTGSRRRRTSRASRGSRRCSRSRAAAGGAAHLR